MLNKKEKKFRAHADDKNPPDLRLRSHTENNVTIWNVMWKNKFCFPQVTMRGGNSSQKSCHRLKNI